MSEQMSDEIEPVSIYLWTMTLACVVLSYLVYHVGGTLGSCVAPTILAWLAIATRARFAFALVPWGVFGTLGVALGWERAQVPTGLAMLLAVVAFVVIASASRLNMMVAKGRVKASSGRIVYDPHREPSVPNVLVPSHFVSILILLSGWWFASYLISDFASAAADQQVYYDYQNWLRRTFRLVPWAYCGIKLVIILAMLFAVVHGALSYLHCRSRRGMMASIRLRSELWRWNGVEQRRIGRAMMRQQKWGLHE